MLTVLSPKKINLEKCSLIQKKVVIRIPDYECNVISEYDVGICKSGDTAGNEEVQINNYEIESVLFEVLSLKTKTILIDIVHQTPI